MRLRALVPRLIRERGHEAFACALLGFLAIGLLAELLGGRFVAVLQGAAGNLLEMSPYLLFGFLVAGILSVVIPASLVERHLGGGGLWPVTKAAAFGVPLPLCSCGVIPVSASLRRHGASRGATTSFLLSTPQTGVDSILVTLSLLGPVYAVFRPLAALVTGIVGGLAVSLFDRDGARGGDEAPAACQDACCAGGGSAGKLARVVSYGFVTLPRDIGRSLLVGLVLAGLIGALVPKDFAGAYGAGLVGMLAMMAVGVPIYVCATASVPIAAALVAKGISPGAALVFLMTGPATNAATITTIWRIMGRRTALIYLATVAVMALAAGLALNAVYAGTGVAPHPHLHETIPYAVKSVAAAGLLALLGCALFCHPHSHVETTKEAVAVEETVRLAVKGMTCSHCAANVSRGLSEVPGVAAVDVDLDGKEAVVHGTGLDPGALCAAVAALGYSASVEGNDAHPLPEVPHDPDA
jgi:uncharacterized membrane protein YraQ (UPF0718 family)/copper chaperone CopZ